MSKKNFLYDAQKHGLVYAKCHRMLVYV